MKKRLLAIFLTCALCLTFFGCIQEPAETQPPTEVPTEAPTEAPTEPPATGGSTPLLYKVTDGDGDVVWLFGSIHVGTPDYYPLPDYVLDAFDGSDALAVEADIVAAEENPYELAGVMAKMLYADGTTIADHISPELYEKAVGILTLEGQYMALIDLYQPVIWWNLIENALITHSQLDAMLGIDRYMIGLAKDSGKELLEVESAQFQMEMLGAFSEELQIFLLEQIVESYYAMDEYLADLDVMAQLWKSGDEAAFEAYLADSDTEELTEEEMALYAEYTAALITNRNLSMTEYAQARLEEGKEVFICVGAAHVVGEGAMAQLLEQAGYTVELVTE